MEKVTQDREEEREKLKDRGLLGIEGLAVGIRGTGWLHAILRIDGKRFYSISSKTLSTYTSNRLRLLKFVSTKLPEFNRNRTNRTSCESCNFQPRHVFIG